MAQRSKTCHFPVDSNTKEASAVPSENERRGEKNDLHNHNSSRPDLCINDGQSAKERGETLPPSPKLSTIELRVTLMLDAY